MRRDPAKLTANVDLGAASRHRKTRARQSATPGLLRKLLGWIRRPRDRLLLDSLSHHMLRDMGIEPGGREDESHVRFWPRR